MSSVLDSAVENGKKSLRETLRLCQNARRKMENAVSLSKEPISNEALEKIRQECQILDQIERYTAYELSNLPDDNTAASLKLVGIFDYVEKLSG
jgi:hypothetical protein